MCIKIVFFFIPRLLLSLQSHVNKSVHVCVFFFPPTVSARFSSFKQCTWQRQPRGGGDGVLLLFFLNFFYFLSRLCSQKIMDTWWQKQNIMQKIEKEEEREGGGDSSSAKVGGLTGTLCSTMQTILCTGCALDCDTKRHNMQPVGQRSGEISQLYRMLCCVLLKCQHI